ncbi:MAG TPA: NepR family anti-sigma factor [Afifellaceae bacterium]|nr:NepR family anti-sigma factor [Afifellaceae bacterium]
MTDHEEKGAGRQLGTGGGGGRRAGKAGEDGDLDPRVQCEIGRQLRAFYDDVISEPVPDRFLELLQQLEKSAGKKC